MTLIIATLTPRGVVLAADRRTRATDNQTGKKFVASEATEKILIGSDIAVAHMGGFETAETSPRDVIEHWVTITYSTELPFRDQAAVLYEEYFKSGENGGFVAVCYRNGKAECCRTNIEGELDYDHLMKPRQFSMKFNGSGNQIAGDLVAMSNPPLAAFDLPDVVEYSSFLISATHSLMKYAKKSEPSVGNSIIAAVVDYRGAHLVKGGDYTVDDPKP
jgi:hypothetical protein